MHLLILHIPCVFGGAERSTANLLSNLDRSRIKHITLVAPAILRSLLPETYDCFIDTTPYRLEARFANLNALHRDARVIGELLRELKPDVAFGMMQYSSALVVLGGRLAGVSTRTVAGYQGPFYEHIRRYEPDLQRRDLLQAIMTETALQADRVIVPTRDISEELKQRFRIPVERIVVIPNGIDLVKVAEAARAAIPELADLDRDGTPVICAVARLAPENNLSLLLEAFQQVHVVCPAILIIIDDGSERGVLESQITAWGLLGAVRFLGYRDIYPCLRRADVFIHICQYEGFENTILEALACGTVVISTDCLYSPREVLNHGEYGILIPDDDPDKLAENILCLLEDPAKRRALAVCGLERAKQLSIQRMVSAYEAEFLKLCRITAFDLVLAPREKNLGFNFSYNNHALIGEVNSYKFAHICMITYNRLEFTRQSLAALFRYTDFPYLLTVVDNGSNDGTVEYLQFLYQRNLIKNLILFGMNVGVAKAANVGWVCEQKADYYIKIDNDLVVQGPWLAAMVDVVDAIHKVGAVAYNVEPFSYPLSIINGCNTRLKETGNLGGACILIPKTVHEKLGFWCEDYGLYGEEDADYCRRIQCAQFLNIYMADENLAFHLPNGKAVIIDPITYKSKGGDEDKLHYDYRDWKDRVRSQNVLHDTIYASNMNGYASGKKSLYVNSQFAHQWILRRHTISNWNDMWFDNICHVMIPDSCTSKKYKSLSVVFSTREADSKFIEHIKNTVGLDNIEVISYVNKGEFSLAELYNKALREAKHDIIIFIHDDIMFSHDNWGLKIIEQFRSSNYGILGIAGTTDLVFGEDGAIGSWWFMHHRRVGKVKYNVNNKTWDDIFSNSYKFPVQVVCLDGVFIAVDRKKIQKLFDERFKGFHYYDIPFSFSNHLANVKVGVTFEVDLIHKSTGNVNSEWHQNRLLFSEYYRDSLPCGVKPEKVEYDNSVIGEFDPGKSVISIIIPTKNKIDLIMDCIQSIIYHTRVARYEILIADTGSTVENKNKLSTWIENLDKKNNLIDIKIIEYHYYNFAKINNDVVKNYLSKKSNYILFCNNDIKVLNDAVDRCLCLFREKKNIGTVGIRLHYRDNSIQHNGMEMIIGSGRLVSFSHRNLGSYYTYDLGLIEVIGNTAAFLMIERSMFEKICFNESYKECYEDVELNLEMLRLGRKNYHIGHAVAYHYESQTRSSNPDKNNRMIEDYQNHLLPFFKKHCASLFFTQLFEAALRASRERQFQTAMEICETLLEYAPHHADIHHLLGVIMGRQSNYTKAVQHIRQAIALNGAIPSYHYNLAEALRCKEDWKQAEQSYRQALQLAPDMVDAYISLGGLLNNQDRLKEAMACYQKALQLKPDHVLAYWGIADILRQQGAYRPAMECYQRIIQIQPNLAEAYYGLGIVLYMANHFDGAAQYFRQVLQYKPDWTEARKNLGEILLQQGLLEEARECYQPILEEQANHALIRLHIESFCPQISASNTAIDNYRETLRTQLLKWQEIHDLTLDLESLHATGLEPPLALIYQGRDDRSLREMWATLFQNLLPKVEPLPMVSGRPHVGFVVTRGHEEVFLTGMKGILNQLSGKHFDLTVVCSQQGGRALLQAGIHNPAIRYLLLPERIDSCVERLRQARFAVLYYWEVGTDTMNYFLPFFRLAPVQCTGWGWPVTSGIPQMDYYLSAQYLETTDSNAHYSERLVKFRRLPVYFHHPELSEKQGERERFGLTADQHLYLCAQNLRKLHPDFDELLAGLLRRDPHGVVMLVESPQPAITAALRQRLQACLPDVIERVQFLRRLPYQDYLDLLAAADVILDTLHFGSGITAYDALAAGRPIVTLPGTFSRGRYVYAAYRQMGLDEGIATNPADYIERAVQFASEPHCQSVFGARLREASKELFEDREAVREFEDFLGVALTESKTF